MRVDFESVVSHLLPIEPVAKHRSTGDKRGAAKISGANGAEISGFGAKPGICKTGVHICYYKEDEYHKLNLDKKSELREWRKTPKYIKKHKGKAKKHPQPRVDNGSLVSAAEKEVAKRLSVAAVYTPRPPDTQPFVTNDEARSYIMRLMKPSPPETAGDTSTSLVKRVTLQSILHKSKLPRG